MKKSLIFISLILLSGISWGKDTAQECYDHAIEESKFQGITQEMSLSIQDEYRNYCKLYADNKDRTLYNFTKGKVITKTEKNKIIKEISELDINNVIILANNFFNYTHEIFLANKTIIPHDELVIFREINKSLKQRMYSFTMPEKIEKLPKEQRDFALRNIHLWQALSDKEKTFQNLDSILYPVEDSIYVINSLHNKKKPQLKFNKIQCEISLTYLNSYEMDICKGQL